MNHGLQWTPQDDLIVLRTDIGIPEKARRLERSCDAVIMRRTRLRRRYGEDAVHRHYIWADAEKQARREGSLP